MCGQLGGRHRFEPLAKITNGFHRGCAAGNGFPILFDVASQGINLQQASYRVVSLTITTPVFAVSLLRYFELNTTFFFPKSFDMKHWTMRTFQPGKKRGALRKNASHFSLRCSSMTSTTEEIDLWIAQSSDNTVQQSIAPYMTSEFNVKGRNVEVGLLKRKSAASLLRFSSSIFDRMTQKPDIACQTADNNRFFFHNNLLDLSHQHQVHRYPKIIHNKLFDLTHQF